MTGYISMHLYIKKNNNKNRYNLYIDSKSAYLSLGYHVSEQDKLRLQFFLQGKWCLYNK